ncbi:MAG TPA: extracellular solute-binding protein [Pseudolysinimonas sp.]|jgi:raffinose/stachyose/melibiose transport system substrate-binding protein
MTRGEYPKARRRLVIGAVGAAIVALLLSACTPGGTTATSTGATAAPFPTGPVTLNLLDYQTSANPQLGAAIDQLISDFQSEHPNVTIKRSATSFSDLLTKQQLLMSGPNPPDISDVAVNYTVEAKFAQSGLITDLQPYADKYKWADKFSPFLYGQSRFDKNGRLGKGDLYGVYFTEDIVGVYYNKQKLAALGLSVPTTFQEFEDSLATIKAAGETPFEFGNQDKWAAIHAFQQVQGSLAPKDYLRDYSYRLKDGMTFDEQWNVAAATKFQQWAQDGYFGSDPNALADADARTNFIKGDGVYHIGGTWDAKTIDDGMGDNAGFFLVPPVDGNSSKLVTLGGLGQTFTIGGKTKAPGAAAAFLNLMVSDKAADLYQKAGAIPGFTFTPAAGATSLRQDVLASVATANKADALVGYLDGPTPRMYDVLTAALQDLIAKKTTPEQFVATIEADYAKGP